MRLTIIKDDNTVMVDGEGYNVDCTALPANFHALQWDGTHGEVEYAMTRCEHCNARSKKGNEDITDVSAYQTYVDQWHVAKNKAIAAAKAAEENAAKAAAVQKELAADATGPKG